MTEAHPVLLSVRGATKVYPGTRALDEVDFGVRGGAVNVLVGENGAGKSTLMKLIAGVEQPTEGRILLDGEEVRFADTRDAARRGVGIIFQELNLFPNMTVAENIFIAREKTRSGVDIDARAQNEAARALMRRLEHDIPPDALVGELRIGEQQIVEIAKALAQDARILIMDEPTSSAERRKKPRSLFARRAPTLNVTRRRASSTSRTGWSEVACGLADLRVGSA